MAITNLKGVFDSSRVHSKPLKERKNSVDIVQSVILSSTYEAPISSYIMEKADLIAEKIITAHKNDASVIITFGAHTIKNGMGQLLGEMAKRNWVTHLATNGAGVIHDWEFAYQGKSSEDVKTNVQKGEFGTWQETGLYINLALAVGAYHQRGYGESVGKMIVDNGLIIPKREELIYEGTHHREHMSSAAWDLLETIDSLHIESGFLPIEHTYSEYSAQAIAHRYQVPFTSHPMFGHDIIYTHKANKGSVIGRTAEIDFLSFVDSVERLEDGVYLSIGSAVMSPMIFEKSLSMVRNALQPIGKDVRNTHIHVVDLQKETWDWSKGEPPMDNPAYYHRFMKTFNRMGCNTHYLQSDNREFLVALFRAIEKRSN